MKNIIIGSLLISSLILPFGSAKADKFKKWTSHRNQTIQRILNTKTLFGKWNHGNCLVDQDRLTYTYSVGKERSMAVPRAEGEELTDLVCGEGRTVILMSGSINIYPGAKELKNIKPEKLSFFRTSLGKFQEGHLSPDGKYVVFRNKKTIEIVRLNGNDITPIESYKLNKQIERVQTKKKSYILYLKGGNQIEYPYEK